MNGGKSPINIFITKEAKQFYYRNDKDIYSLVNNVSIAHSILSVETIWEKYEILCFVS